MRRLILKIIDFFYIPLFAKWIPFRTFRYAVCGGFNTTLDLVLYYISYHFILHEQMLSLGFVTISAPIAAFLMAFCISFPTGFSLSKFVVFPESVLKGRTQLVRYLLIVLCNVSLNYILLKFFVDVCHIYPTISKAFTAIIISCFSYLTQKHFTFRIRQRLKAKG
ncbi:MAG: GtrA family protein [Chitinophagaceae bacterium]